MNKESPVAAYRDACKTYHEIRDFYDPPEILKRLRLQDVVLQSCFQRLLKAADSQDPAVWHALGDAFGRGMGTVRDVAESIRWLKRAAEAGHSPAMVSLGLRLQLPKPSLDPVGAIYWLRRAAESGNASGMIFLGFAYREGTDVPCDLDEAVRWFIKAVEAGDDHSMLLVGCLYYYRLKSPEEAVMWFLRAAKAGYPESFIELATVYDDKKSKLYDPAEANKWYRVVAEHSEGHHARALLSIARQYAEGQGVPCDVEMAKLWLRRLLQAVPQKSSAHRDASKMLKKLDDSFL